MRCWYARRLVYVQWMDCRPLCSDQPRAHLTATCNHVLAAKTQENADRGLLSSWVLGDSNRWSYYLVDLDASSQSLTNIANPRQRAESIGDCWTDREPWAVGVKSRRAAPLIRPRTRHAPNPTSAHPGRLSHRDKDLSARRESQRVLSYFAHSNRLFVLPSVNQSISHQFIIHHSP